MKPLHVAVLVAAAALGGAVVMKVFERPQPPAPVAAESPAPLPPAGVQAPPPAPEPQSPPASLPVAKAKAKPRPARHTPEPVAVQTAPPAAPVPIPQPVAEVAPPAPRAPENVAPPPAPSQVTLNAGMLIPVRLIDGLSSERNNPGDAFTGTLDQPLVANGLVIAERGARVEGQVASSDRGGRVKGVASISVLLTRIHLSDGQTISVTTDGFKHEAESSKKTDATKVGAGAAIGAVIGAIAGGGKGAAIGAGVGGGAGAGDVLLTRGKPATLPSETRISFRLSQPVTVTERR
jgi:hypothetical protein